MEKYKNGVRKPQKSRMLSAQLVSMFDEPEGYNCPPNALISVLMFNPKTKVENVREELERMFGEPNTPVYSSGWTSWPDWQDWKVRWAGETSTIRLMKTGPRSCRVGLFPVEEPL